MTLLDRYSGPILAAGAVLILLAVALALTWAARHHPDRGAGVSTAQAKLETHDWAGTALSRREP
jgi:hypothetical protein